MLSENKSSISTNSEKSFLSYEFVIDRLKQNTYWQKEIRKGCRIGLYKFVKDIGNGNFSQVKLGIHSLTKDKVAVKIIDKSKLNAKTIRFVGREVSCLEKMEHQNILHLFQVIYTASKIFIVSEYADGGDLHTKINDEGRLQERTCKIIFNQIVLAVDYMHGLGIIHRDLKAENVFFSRGKVKIGDFGFSTHVEQGSLLNTYCGSPPYAAPELFKDEFYVGEAVDVWALGILLYFMATALLPFQADTIKKLKALILQGSFIIPAFVTIGCSRLIRNILLPNPTDRLKVDDILADQWVRSVPSSNPRWSKSDSMKKISEETLEEEVMLELEEYNITGERLKVEMDEYSSHLAAVYRIVKYRKRFGVDHKKDGLLKISKKNKATSKFCIIL